MTARSVAAAAAASLILLTTTACSSGPLDITCEDYLALTASEQQDVAREWVKENSAESLADVMAPSTADDIARHCQDNPDDVIGDLQYTFGR